MSLSEQELLDAERDQALVQLEAKLHEAAQERIFYKFFVLIGIVVTISLLWFAFAEPTTCNAGYFKTSTTDSMKAPVWICTEPVLPQEMKP